MNIVSGTTRFMAGKFPFMMFGLPAAAFAMYRAALPSKRKVVGSLLLAAAVTSFLTGITEPFKNLHSYSLLQYYMLFTVSLQVYRFMLMDIFNVFIGMTFSGGVIDFSLFGLLPAGAGFPTNWLWVLIVGAAYAVIYYFVFYFLITKMNLKTPGRDENEGETKLYTKADYQKSKGGATEAAAPSTAGKGEIAEKAPFSISCFRWRS